MNLGGQKSGTSTAFSVSEVVNEEGDFGKRNQESLKALARIHSSWSHTVLFITIPSNHLNVMGIHACWLAERLCLSMNLELILFSCTSFQTLYTERFASSYCNHHLFPHNFHLARHSEVYSYVCRCRRKKWRCAPSKQHRQCHEYGAECSYLIWWIAMENRSKGRGWKGAISLIPHCHYRSID